eukprot:scaffold201_cov405-Prasinococcus_capsulatus_cf.AAC.28
MSPTPVPSRARFPAPGERAVTSQRHHQHLPPPPPLLRYHSFLCTSASSAAAAAAARGVGGRSAVKSGCSGAGRRHAGSRARARARGRDRGLGVAPASVALSAAACWGPARRAGEAKLRAAHLFICTSKPHSNDSTAPGDRARPSPVPRARPATRPSHRYLPAAP